MGDDTSFQAAPGTATGPSLRLVNAQAIEYSSFKGRGRIIEETSAVTNSLYELRRSHFG